MAWNEPGGNNQDPWGNNRNDQGPPDLDELIKKLQDRISGLFGGRSGGGNGGGNDSDQPSAGRRSGGGQGSAIGIGVIAAIALLVWALSGFYTVEEAERGVVLRFGKHVETASPGLNWHLPYPIETVEKVDVSQVQTSRYKALMLTKDENIIAVELAVQFRVSDPAQYLFKVRSPRTTLRDITESAIREVVGKSTMDFILTEGRAQIVERTRALIQEILDRYEAGLLVSTVNLQDAQPPEEVQEAFADAIKAREDEQRLKNEAEAYEKRVVNNATGTADRLLEESRAYRAEVVARAEGDTARFEQLLVEYTKAPKITRERLYIDAMESVLSKSSKVMIDVEGGNNLMYLPLDRLIGGGGAMPGMSDDDDVQQRMNDAVDQVRQSRGRVVQRGREVRR
ncbi:MAG: FtsH protease activity modulator HflK [Gammaproteobacteria bacterium]